MERRTLLTGITGTLFGAGGCLETGTSWAGGNEDSVPGCTQKDEWSGESNGTAENPDPASIAGRHDCLNAQRPEPTGNVCTTFTPEISGQKRTIHSAGIEPYPDPPASFNQETLVSYVSDYEYAYFQNSMVERYWDRLTGAGIGIEEDETRIENTESAITVVRIQFMTTSSTLSSGGLPAAGDGAGAAVYGIDETGVVRAETEYSASNGEMPDPVEDGTLLECY